MDDSEKKNHDILLLHSRTKDGEGIRGIRSRPGRLEAAELRPLKEGKPLSSGEVIQLSPRSESPLLWDVNVKCVLDEQASDASASNPIVVERGGPARVASRQYRQNWDLAFGSSKAAMSASKKNKMALN